MAAATPARSSPACSRVRSSSPGDTSNAAAHNAMRPHSCPSESCISRTPASWPYSSEDNRLRQLLAWDAGAYPRVLHAQRQRDEQERYGERHSVSMLIWRILLVASSAATLYDSASVG